ncbi:RNA pseudouridylate synthase domain-containing protein 1 [Tribolium castaneum]|uniref:RNA pseudouridylate synthase domain-containing protein 1-like Protein n=1 Tax=Tribolium castaneum TaxID=7070 RepID=D6W746_TRICA|nr:PREDICTED: RNA pseudouridylate synthase domain-containing protein 1 [Tribolium castaneum]EFA11504.2 RNA pseudouridylate synthase domain-containing protein 1-like Protein [Tribolium castaneum]|eukprot:XP_001814310.1 PREDICTED: RNA pseudouridylate synthase domain-containing protein 1 [Tribolium castaneum]
MSHLKLCLLIQKIWKSVYKSLTDLFANNYKNTTIVHRSANFIIIDKAYDLKINSNNRNEETVQTFMKKNLPYLASNQLHHEYYFMHRLDYSTSGLMCVPVHKKACQVASQAIQQRKCKKYYIALVRGYLSSNLLDLNFPIGRDNSITDIEKMCVTHDSNSRSARTLIVVLENGLFENYPSSKVLIRPITGRRHQIRVHCAHIGHTIVGDYTYSNKKDTTPERMYLHSLRLVIPNKIEDINVQTSDPFSEKGAKCWKPVFRLCDLSRAFEIIDEL